MNKIPVLSLLADFKMMFSEHWSYGQEVKRGQVDCSGAFVWSYKQHGLSIYHGSNRIARTEVLKLYPIDSVQIVPGMACFKHRVPDESGYTLPSSYKPGGSNYNGDLNDYYHIGLVAEDRKHVYNAQSSATGFVSSDISKGWSHVGYLTQVAYDTSIPDTSSVPEQTTPSEEKQKVDPAPVSSFATVVAKSGSTVKMRQTPSKNERVWWPVPIGSTVEIRGSESKGWYPIRYSGRNGYMMSEYLSVSADNSSETLSDEKRLAVTIVDLTWDEANVLLKEYSGRSFLGDSNG